MMKMATTASATAAVFARAAARNPGFPPSPTIRRYDIPMTARRFTPRALVATAIFGLAIPLAHAQQAAPAQPPAAVQPPAVGTAQISGVVRLSSDDAPVARARV